MTTETQAMEAIEREVSAEWERSKQPLLISKLGGRLDQETKALIAATGHGLKRFIQENLGDRVRVLAMKSHGGAVVPSEATRVLSDEDMEASFSTQPRPTTSEDEQIPMYWGDVWRGFQSDLAPGTTRYIVWDASGKPEVREALEGAALPANAKVVLPTDLVVSQGSGPRHPRSDVNKAIANWCLREGISVSSLKFDRQGARRPASQTSARVASVMQGMDLLSRDELARISIPADLVMAILERSGLK